VRQEAPHIQWLMTTTDESPAVTFDPELASSPDEIRRAFAALATSAVKCSG
jgi:hypothetical protein